MRIIHVSCVAPPEIGGIGRVAAKEVASLVERGHDAHLVSLTSHAGFRIGNVGIIHALEHFVRDADIVHLHYPFYGTAGTIARLKRRGTIKKLVMTLHMDAMAPGWRSLAANLHRRFSQPKILEAADALLVSSRDYAEHSSFAPVAARAIELPFGVDEIVFSHGLSQRDRFGISEDVSVILFVGGMDKAHEFKGVPVLLEAVAKGGRGGEGEHRGEGEHIGSPLQRAHLLLVGEGDQRATYERKAASLGVASRCHFVGRLDEAGLVDAYRSADVFAFPSTSGAEAFGLAALEAQACGVPVVASDLPGVRTVVAHEETGLLVPPHDVNGLSAALSRILSDASLKTRMGERARERVLERFTWNKHMDGLITVYEKLCASPS